MTPCISQQLGMVTSKVDAAVEELTAATGAAPLVIGKSLGSLAAPVAAQHGLAAVWFTPLLTEDSTGQALERTTSPFLLVGGTADPFWDGRIARSLPGAVVEIEGPCRLTRPRLVGHEVGDEPGSMFHRAGGRRLDVPSSRSGWRR
jgi:hypothetical protein